MNPSSSTIQERLASIRTELPQDVTLVAVSKTKPIECIEEALATNQFDFGENRDGKHFAAPEMRPHE